MHNNFAPFTVVDFNKNFLINFVRGKTGWDQRSQISDKTQLNYLYNYLANSHIQAKTIVAEDEYIDRHYLEDYSEYYARCFPNHPRKCSRLHFFSFEFSQSDFLFALENNKKSFFKKLSDSYIGFAVIRPIPHTFLAKVCLKPYTYFENHQDYKLIAKKNVVSLFGLSLEVHSAAFLEQDKVVSACATSALWMLFNSSEHEFNGSLPSPSAITKSATVSTYEGSRTFPTKGLTAVQVARSLKHFGFEPFVLRDDFDKNYHKLKEILFSYISNDIPVLIGGDVYQKNKTGKITHLGRHFICALGFKLSNLLPPPSKSGLRLAAHRIEKIYVHDDRYGPYIRVSMTPEYVSPTPQYIKKKTTNKKIIGLALSLHDVDETDYFVPDLALLGLYHKVRLTYNDISEFCNAFFFCLQKSKLMLESALSKQENQIIGPEKNYYQSVCQFIKKLLDGTVEITLTNNTKIKQNVNSCNQFSTFNGVPTKSSCLMHSMPKYIWRCRVYGGDETHLYTDILFDATEVPQGQVLVGYISYDVQAERVWNYVKDDISRNTWDAFNLDTDTRRLISGFLKFFSKSKNNINLNMLYGPLGYPRRDLKNGETDHFDNIRKRSDVHVIRAGSTDFWSKLDVKLKYIWVINEMGDLVLGEDKHDGDEYQGHPTLVDGKAARIGGELFFDNVRKAWSINSRSNTYSKHIKSGTALWRGYLQQVAHDNLPGKKILITR